MARVDPARAGLTVRCAIYTRKLEPVLRNAMLARRSLRI
jgi:hypothetical protein